MNNIKKISGFVFIMVILTLTSCKDEIYEKVEAEQKKITDSINNTIEGKLKQLPRAKLETITYEGCEYLIFKEEFDTNSAYGFMAHKGNCSNPIHIYNKNP